MGPEAKSTLAFGDACWPRCVDILAFKASTCTLAHAVYENVATAAQALGSARNAREPLSRWTIARYILVEVAVVGLMVGNADTADHDRGRRNGRSGGGGVGRAEAGDRQDSGKEGLHGEVQKN